MKNTIRLNVFGNIVCWILLIFQVVFANKPEPKTAIFRNQNPNQATKRIQIGFERAAGDAPLLASDLLVFSLV